jgi:hypothetical protein
MVEIFNIYPYFIFKEGGGVQPDPTVKEASALLKM